MSETNSSKKWLKEASMRRLSLYIKNKTEQVGNAMIFDTTMSLPEEDIEKSGLSSSEIYHLQRWVAGVETGRQCMLAILDYRMTQNNDEHKKVVRKDDFQPMELIKSMINLPNEFLCDSGYIYTTIFQRPPTSVIKEALLLVVQKAFEKFPSSLGIEQINLAIKQLRIDSLVVGIDNNSMCSKSSDDDVDENIKLVGTVEEEFFRLQILIELIRMHIIYCNKKNDLAKASLLEPTSDFNKDENYILPKSSSSIIEDIDLLSGNLFTNPSVQLGISDIEQHLRTPIEKAVEQAEQMSPDDLEGVNSLLKPYLKQLSELKSILSDHLKDLQESKSFLALGLSSDASDEAIKKAYRTLAIKLHPDKPGGDTQKFQQLQDAYQEVMKKKKHDKSENEAMNEMKPNKNNSKTSNNQYEQKKSSKSPQDNQSNNHKDNNQSSEDLSEKEIIPANDDNNKEETSSTTDEVDSITEDEMNEIDQEILDDENKTNIERNENTNKVTIADDDTLEDFMKKIEKNQDNVKNILNNDDNEDDDEYIDDTTVLNANKSKKTYENGTEHAQDIVNQIGEFLQRIKSSAGEITKLAQLNIKWQKMIEKAMEQPYSLKEVYKIITASNGIRSVLKRKDKLVLPISNMEACALHQAIFPLENICEWTQQISALAMEIPNNCGKEYASAASVNKLFIYSIERSMHLSLGALKTVISLINAQEQLASCIRRVKDSMKLATENPEIQSLLLEMVRTGIKSNVVTMSNTVDRVIETTMAASDVRDAAQQLMREVDIFVKAEVKRKAADSESREMEEEYCEEDREALRKCREDRREEDRKNMSQRSSGSSSREGGGDKNKENGCDEDKNSESNSLNELKDKIRILQMQLKIQHIQALQTLNSEVVILQTQIFKELKALPFIVSIDSIFSYKLHKQNLSSNSTMKDTNENVIDFKLSLVTLLADIVDSTCNALKLEFTRFPYNTIAAAVDGGDDDIILKDHNIFKARRSLIEKHLSWMFIVLADGSCAKATLKSFFVTLINSISNNDNIETLYSYNDDNISMNPSIKLALFPDYRAKCLYLASMVDISAVHTILGIELQQRIEELLFEGKLSSTMSPITYSTTTVVTQINDSLVEQEHIEPHIDHSSVEDIDIEQININIIDITLEEKLCSIDVFDIDEEIYQHPDLIQTSTITIVDELESLPNDIISNNSNSSSSSEYQENISFVENKLKPQSNNIEKVIDNENIKPNIYNYAI